MQAFIFVAFWGIAGLVVYFLIVGGILIWPIVNVLAYLKVLLFPSAVRKIHAVDLDVLSNTQFTSSISYSDVEYYEEFESMTETNVKAIKAERTADTEIKKLEKLIKSASDQFEALGNLPRNKDGRISQRSNKGKQGVELQKSINSHERDLGQINGKYSSEIEKYENSLEIERDKLFSRPFNDWLEWRGRMGRYLGNRDAIVFMVVGFPLYFFILSIFSWLDLEDPSFLGIIELYVYTVFVGPVSGIFDLDVFKEGTFSILITYDYASYLSRTWDSAFTFYNWLLLTLPMPILTLCTYALRYHQHTSKADTVRPTEKMSLKEIKSALKQSVIDDVPEAQV